MKRFVVDKMQKTDETAEGIDHAVHVDEHESRQIEDAKMSETMTEMAAQ